MVPAMEDRKMRHSRVEFWDDERRIGNSLIVTLKPGFAFFPADDESVAEHVRGFDRVRDAEAAVRRSQPCRCGRCLREKH